jgi:tetratricopeptide (TPR) repeat protein
MNAPIDPILDQAQLHAATGRRGDTLRLLAGFEAVQPPNPNRLARAAMLLTQLGAHEAALRCHLRLFALLPGNPQALKGLAAAETATGLMAEAEAHLDQAIARDPGDFDAWYNRSTLRRQTFADNHIEQLRAMLAGPAAGNRGEIPLCHALSKELEDLSEHAASFAYLKRGADRRRAALSYKVEGDIETMAAIAETFTPELLARPVPAASEEGPIFILGLPRSGTTLIDRILSSHPDVESFGELSDFAMALTSGISGATSKGDFVRRAGAMDFAALGRRYLAGVNGFARAKPLFIDKLPSNFLYIGLIRLALPRARIVHLRRRPMDAGYAIYKTLFRMGYPYSYDQADLGRYMAAYYRLMDHWRRAAPGFVIDVDYETLVASPEPTVRALLAACDLPWNPACLDFHARSAPVATASAAQVREPIYTSSVGLWRRYESGLVPLARALAVEGVPIDG